MEDLDIKDGEQVEVTLKDKEAVIRPKTDGYGDADDFVAVFPDSNGFGGAVFSGLLYLFSDFAGADDGEELDCADGDCAG